MRGRKKRKKRKVLSKVWWTKHWYLIMQRDDIFNCTNQKSDQNQNQIKKVPAGYLLASPSIWEMRGVSTRMMIWLPWARCTAPSTPERWTMREEEEVETSSRNSPAWMRPRCHDELKLTTSMRLSDILGWWNPSGVFRQRSAPIRQHLDHQVENDKDRFLFSYLLYMKECWGEWVMQCPSILLFCRPQSTRWPSSAFPIQEW